MKIIDVLEKRWSPRAFENREVDQATIEQLLEAARWAPSSMNEQPWLYFYSLKGDKGFDKMLNCLVPGNMEWAKESSALILSVARKKFKYKNRPNRHAMHDTGAANALLATQAAGIGLQVHQMGGFDMNKTLDLFNLSTEDHEPASFIAVGYQGKPEMLNQELQKRETAPRQRASLNEISKRF